MKLEGRFFFFNDTATTEIYTLSLHDALPILAGSTGFNPFWLNCQLTIANSKQSSVESHLIILMFLFCQRILTCYKLNTFV